MTCTDLGIFTQKLSVMRGVTKVFGLITQATVLSISVFQGVF